MRNKISFQAFTTWLTSEKHNLRSFSIFRILYAVGLLAMFLPSIPDRALLWGHASFWVDPEAKRRGFHTFDTIFSKDNELLFDAAYAVLIILLVLLLIGWRTRIVTPLLLLLLVSIQAGNPYVLNGGDTLIRITLLFVLFAHLSEHYSLDAIRRKRREARGMMPKRIVPSYVSNAAHNLGLILCCFQIIVVYLTSGVWKLLGADWLNNTALYYALRLDIFAAYPMVNDFLWQSSLAIYLATFIALWVQTLFPVMILWRPTRIFALASLIFMHLGIAVLLGLWPFSLAMIALDMLYIRDSSWNSMIAWLTNTKLGVGCKARWADKTKRLARGFPTSRKV